MRKKYLCLLLFSLVFLLFPSFIRAEIIKLKVVAATANIRALPDLESRIVGQAGAGKILESEERTGEWFKVSLPPGQGGSAVTGYIHMSTVAVQGEAPRPSAAIPSQMPQPETAPSPEPDPPQISSDRFSFKLTGGFARFDGGDASANRTGYNAYWSDQALQPGSGIEIDGETQSFHSGMNFEAEVIYSLNSRLSVGFGVAYLQASVSQDQSRMVIRWPGAMRTVSRGNTISAIPITLGVYYDLLPGRKWNLFLNAGVGYYLACWKELEDYESETEGVSYWKKYETKAHTGGIGFYGGLGFEYRIRKNLSLVIEGFGRYARFSGFEGEYREQSSEGTDATEKGKLYYYEWTSNQKLYPWVELLDRDPNEINFSSPISNAREAVIDFSGFSLRAGIKISL